MSAFGLSPLGTELGPLGGPGLITVLGVLPTTNNSSIVVFDTDPSADDPLSAPSATNPKNYTLVALDPTYSGHAGPIVPQGKAAPTRFPSIVVAEQDDEDPKQVQVFSETTLEPRVDYLVVVSTRIRGSACETFAGEDSWGFRGLQLSVDLRPVELVEERYRDFNFAFFGEEGYVFDPSGDIAIQNASDSLKKRLYRRVFTKPGEFAWTSNYGASVSMKSLAKANQLQLLAGTIRDQALREPDVRNAAVTVSIGRAATGTFLDIRAVVLREDATTTSLQIVEPLDG